MFCFGQCARLDTICIMCVVLTYMTSSMSILLLLFYGMASRFLVDLKKQIVLTLLVLVLYMSCSYIVVVYMFLALAFVSKVQTVRWSSKDGGCASSQDVDVLLLQTNFFLISKFFFKDRISMHSAAPMIEMRILLLPTYISKQCTCISRGHYGQVFPNVLYSTLQSRNKVLWNVCHQSSVAKHVLLRNWASD